MLVSRVIAKRSRATSSGRFLRHALACQDLFSKSLSTACQQEDDSDTNEINSETRSFRLTSSLFHVRHEDSLRWARQTDTATRSATSISFESRSLDAFRPSWLDVSASGSIYENEYGVNNFPSSRARVVSHPPSISRQAMRQLIYTSTIRALNHQSKELSSPFKLTMHRVVQRACFSSQPEPPSDGTASSNVAPLSQPKSFSTSAATPSSDDNRSYSQRAREAIASTSNALVTFLLKLPGVMWFYLTHPKDLYARLQELKEAAKKEAHHYWMGSKLLAADVRTAYKMLKRTLQGSSLTRRERKQLLRTVSDLFRLVPFSMFILIPFMEFALPLALRLFPNMLPSTFQDSLKEEENMKRELKSRIAMAQFFQETLEELVTEQKKVAQSRKETNDNQDGKVIAAKQEESASSMLEFLEKARKGEIIPPDIIIQYAHYFQDDLTLDNMPRMQLINMCKYMNIPPYGADSFLRFQLRYKIRSLKEDDQRILWEGINSLTKMELREACRERGMRSTGLSKDAYKRALQQWLDLSVNKNVPISVLIMSRTFFLRDEMTPASADDDGSKSIADAISGLDKDVLNEVVLKVATSEEKKSSVDVARIKLEVIEAQNERIQEEREERETAERFAAKRKEEKEKSSEAVVEDPAETGTAEAMASPIEFESDKTKIRTLEDEKATAASSSDAASSKEEYPAETAPGEEVIEEATELRDEVERELSTQEMEALSQLVNPDPVNSEREHLKRIKAAMKDEAGGLDVVVSKADGEEVLMATPVAQAAPEAVEKAVAKETPSATPAPVSKDEVKPVLGVTPEAQVQAESETQTIGEAVVSVQEKKLKDTGALDKSIKRLKSKVESMVDKIETQLSDVQVKIGDKLHFLDKDMDGIVSREEMALCLQQVLKRELTFEDALNIATEMDENNDGVLTVAEFIKWIETNKLVKMLEEGQDTDIDSILEKYQNEERSSSEP